MPLLSSLGLDIQPEVLNALTTANFKNTEDLLGADIGFVAKKSGISLENIANVVSEARKVLTATPIRCDNLFNNLCYYDAVFSTGCQR